MCDRGARRLMIANPQLGDAHRPAAQHFVWHTSRWVRVSWGLVGPKSLTTALLLLGSHAETYAAFLGGPLGPTGSMLGSREDCPRRWLDLAPASHPPRVISTSSRSG